MNKEGDLLTYFKDARSFMAAAGFNLRSWSSNSAKLLQLAKEENVLDTDNKPSTSTELVLHVFTDASPKAYGAAVYLSNENEATLVMAKTRVAPVKCLTLPQRELHD
ncbi:Hypothetical predicted protein [Mytilus galloprovincialis]|uniref:Uncharacterized protein n=1 Tax=Mytilus galloprovincialis TaxID=29158 RepID=A0A8B6HHB2_MYTGA|nr:Hypothetical predicted protein [Mytilus galloprovincialis]